MPAAVIVDNNIRRIRVVKAADADFIVVHGDCDISILRTTVIPRQTIISAISCRDNVCRHTAGHIAVLSYRYTVAKVKILRQRIRECGRCVNILACDVAADGLKNVLELVRIACGKVIITVRIANAPSQIIPIAAFVTPTVSNFSIRVIGRDSIHIVIAAGTTIRVSARENADCVYGSSETILKIISRIHRIRCNFFIKSIAMVRITVGEEHNDLFAIIPCTVKSFTLTIKDLLSQVETIVCSGCTRSF